MKLSIVWSNGDKEKLEVSEEYAKNFAEDRKNNSWNWSRWTVVLEDDRGGLNMAHARKVLIED